MARWGQLDAQGFGGPPVAIEDPEKVAEDDSEEDPIEDFDPWDDPASD